MFPIKCLLNQCNVTVLSEYVRMVRSILCSLITILYDIKQNINFPARARNSILSSIFSSRGSLTETYILYIHVCTESFIEICVRVRKYVSRMVYSMFVRSSACLND